jgi:hypothetical protein
VVLTREQQQQWSSAAQSAQACSVACSTVLIHHNTYSAYMHDACRQHAIAACHDSTIISVTVDFQRLESCGTLLSTAFLIAVQHEARYNCVSVFCY